MSDLTAKERVARACAERAAQPPEETQVKTRSLQSIEGERIALWIGENDRFAWDFEINGDHPPDAVIARVQRTRYGMTDDGWRLPQTKERCLVEPVHGGSFERCDAYPKCPCGGPQDETEERPELCGHDDGSHCDESCAEKVRKYKEWMAANARTNGYDPNEIF